MFKKIKDLEKAWEKRIINLYPAADKGTPGFFAAPKESYTNINLYHEKLDENEKQWLEDRPKNKKFFSHAYYWDKSPFKNFDQLMNIANGKINSKELSKKIEGWCVLIGRGSKTTHLKDDDGGVRLACIDIDGYKPENDTNNEIRKRSCDEIYNAISKNADFDFFAERSQGGGYHIWYTTKQQVLTKQVYHLNNLMFPEGSEFEGLVLNDRKNDPNRNKEFIEVFSKGGGKYVSCSPTSKYEFVDDEPVELLKMKPVEDINTELKKALVKAGFIYNLDPTSEISIDEKSSKQDSSYVKGDYNLDELQENILNCYREGNMNSFGYILMDNFRRANYTKDEVFEIFKKLPLEQDLDKVKTDLNQQYSVDYDSIAGLSGLQKAIEEFCTPESLNSTYQYFTNFFKKEIVNSKCEPKWEELNTPQMILKENKLFILYNGEYWVSEALKKKGKWCEDVLDNIEEHNLDATAYLVVMQDKLGYHYGWSINDGNFSFDITPNFYQSFLDKKDGKRNKFIGQSANYFGVKACTKSISLFLEYIKEQFKKDENGYCAKQKLAHNTIIYNYMEYLKEANGISIDTLNKVKLLNNQYLINDSINKEMKIIEKKAIEETEFTPEGKEKKIEIYGEIDKDIIGKFAITGLSILEDVLGEKDIKEAKIVSKEGLKNIKFDKTKKFIENIDDTLGISAQPNMAKKGILEVMNFIIANKVNYEHGFYSSADGIFAHNNDLFWFKDNNVKEIEKPNKDELNKAIKVLKKFFKHTSIKDKSKIATIFKWFLSAPFAYLIRNGEINGNYIKFINLIGESDTGKSAVCLIFNNIWGVDVRHKGTDAHNATNFAELFKLSGFPLFIDEADDILNDDEKLLIIKSIYDRNFSRSKKELINNAWEQKKQIALSIAILTSNTYYESTEKSEVKRVINITFNPEDASNDKGKSFKEIFNVDADEGYKNSDFTTFEAFGREFFHQVKEKYKEKTFEDILNTFLESLGVEEVLLKYDDSEALNKNIDDLYRRAIIDLIVDDFNKVDRYTGTYVNFPIEEEKNSKDVDIKLDTEKLKALISDTTTERMKKFIAVVEEKRIPYLSMTKDYKNIQVEGGINKELKKKGYKFDNMNIRTIHNLFKEYNQGINVEGKNIRYVNIPIELLGI